MEKFVKLLTQETVSTIEGLTGKSPSINRVKSGSISETITSFPLVFMLVEVSGDANATIGIIDKIDLATALSDLMLGGDGASSSEASNDDLDALKEINANILGAIATSMGSQQDMPNLNFSPQKIEVINDDSVLSAFNEAYEFSFMLNAIQSSFFLLTSPQFSSIFEGSAHPVSQGVAAGDSTLITH